jgi:hypothetical protein
MVMVVSSSENRGIAELFRILSSESSF